MKKTKAIIHIFNVEYEAEFDIELRSDGSAKFELLEPIILPPGTFRVFHTMEMMR